ncbi:hypothetical protein vseg_003413 [Gypsophila vaccaria]
MPNTGPLIWQSKKLCASCLYLFTSLFLAFYTSLSPTNKCVLFRSTPFNPIQSPLFSYPPSYGEHKHVLPTFRSSCTSPIFFSDYSSILKEIQQSCRNWNHLPLRYMQGKAYTTFGGNFGLQKRISFFDQVEQRSELPCGFLKSFLITQYDREAMNNCREVVVVSAIFGDHDKIRQPKGLGSKTLEMACFVMFVDDATLRGLLHHNLISKQSIEHKIGVWRLVNVSSDELYRNPAMNGVIPKYLVHRLFPNSKYSIWIDAKLQLVVDPLLLIHSLVIKEDVDMAISRHPFFIHTMDEALATTRWRKWLDIDAIKVQMETYCENGLRPWSPTKLPYPSDVPDTALILRKHGVANNLFSCLMFNELDAFNHRDQLAFAYVRDKMEPKIKINMFENEVFEQIVLEFRHNLKRGETLNASTRDQLKIKRATLDTSTSKGLGKCHNYFLEMWGESHA